MESNNSTNSGIDRDDDTDVESDESGESRESNNTFTNTDTDDEPDFPTDCESYVDTDDEYGESREQHYGKPYTSPDVFTCSTGREKVKIEEIKAFEECQEETKEEEVGDRRDRSPIILPRGRGILLTNRGGRGHIRGLSPFIGSLRNERNERNDRHDLREYKDRVFSL